MKKTIILLLITNIGLISACKNELHDVQASVVPNLKQTVWKGTISVSTNNQPARAELQISFDNERSGNYSIFAVKNSYFENFSDKTNLTYVQDGRILYIEGGYQNILTGKWWLIDSKNNNLRLVRNMETPNASDTLSVQKSL